MSLLRLLTAGKSLVGLKDGGPRYNLARGSLLPKFGSKKNPFRTSTPPEAVTVPAGDLAKPSESAQEATGHSLTQEHPPFQDHPVVPGSTILPTDQAPSGARADCPGSTAVGASATDRRGGSVWASILPWKRARAEKPATPRFAKSMVQGELSLEAVKVVRNDLSDSDLEIVPARPTITATPKPTETPPPRPVPAENNWNRLAGRMFGAGKT